jgi:hypothetical protein
MTTRELDPDDRVAETRQPVSVRGTIMIGARSRSRSASRTPGKTARGIPQ